MDNNDDYIPKLHFARSKSDATRTVIFKDENARQEYIKFESADKAYRNAFSAHAAALTPEFRESTAKTLDITRYGCYTRWYNNKYGDSSSPITNRPSPRAA